MTSLKLFSFLPCSAVLQGIDFFSILIDCEDLVSKNTFPHGTSSFLWNWKLAVLIAFVWPLVFLHCNTFGWVDFVTNTFQYGMKMYSVNNTHCMNIVWIKRVLGLAVIHPVFLHLNLWFCLNAGSTVRQKCHVDQQNTYSKIRKTHNFLFHPFLSPSLHSSKNFLNLKNLKQCLRVKWNWTEYCNNYLRNLHNI